MGPKARADMKRRNLILALGGVVVAWQAAGRAQQSSGPVIGFLSPRSPDESSHLIAAFRRGLGEAGLAEGQNASVEYRWALGEYAKLPMLATELVRGQIDVLVAVGGEPAVLAAKAATSTIPIIAVFVGDPVESGLVASLNRPGGNITGISGINGTLETKRLGLLHELVQRAMTLGLLLNPNFPAAARQLKDMQEAARSIDVQLQIFNARTDPEIDAAFETVAQRRIRGLVVAADTLFVTHRDRLVALAARHAVPAIYSLREFAALGGLMSYGIDLQDLYRNVGLYAGRILKGTRPADLPIMQPTKFEMVINMKTARKLDLAVPATLLAQADEVIE
ncbi:MAG: ABC transporter substrate-binding protein [Alphaproteobacteria bacterium]|nr:MAG: ABC transporter substrate-binding protein [Alphaproteobacteria bacterium]